MLLALNAKGADLGKSAPTTAAASTESATTVAADEAILQSFEPITGGLTKDSDDVRFMDVNFSLKIRLTPKNFIPSVRPFLAMSTRFGFYWGTRPNSPVIGKSYNPMLLFRILPPQSTIFSCGQCAGSEYGEFFDIGYAHQSNGQMVHTLAQYQLQLQSSPGAQYANNFIHRGWDYVDASWKKTFDVHKGITVYAEGKYFIPNGWLQGPEDQYHSWENSPEGKPRDAVDGVELSADWPSQYAHYTVNTAPPDFRPNLTVRYLTGYQTPFRYSTVRAEFGVQLWTLPVALWIQDGYMSSLANYYRKVRSVGVELRFESF